MRTAAPRVGLDHAILLPNSAAFACALLAAAVIGALPWRSAAAQAAPCTSIENDAERLACYDRALRAAPPAPATQSPAAQAPAPQSAPTAAPQATSPAPAAQQRERNIRESAAPVAPAAPAAGASGGANDDDDDGVIPIVIIGMRGLPGRETIFTTKDGASWVQTDAQRIAGLPEPPFEAELKPGTLGSYFLVPKEHGRAIRVREAAR